MRSDAEENQQEIMSCAKRLFAEQGVSEVSMNQIAKTLGIGAGTLYRHYANKSALCMALVYDDLAAFVEASRHYLMENKEPAQDQFQSILTRYLQFRETHNELLLNVDAGSESASGSYFYASKIYQSVIEIFVKILHAALPALTAQTCQFRADMLIAMLKSDAYNFQRQVRLLDQETLIKEMTLLFLG